jgi:hypothetical protein
MVSQQMQLEVSTTGGAKAENACPKKTAWQKQCPYTANKAARK